MELIVANLYGKTKKATLNGREHLVVPMTLIVEGVLNGSQGPLFYPAEELSKDPTVWNGMPLILNHPVVNGTAVSARIPDILEQYGLGTVFNSTYEDSKTRLSAEGWFDALNTQRISPATWNNIKSGKPVGLSTGLFTENSPAPANSKDRMGRAYNAIARNYRPDHVAILPDTTGACSVMDGCGVNLNQAYPLIANDQSGSSPQLTLWQTLGKLLGIGGQVLPITNQMSFMDIRSALSAQLRERYPGLENEYGYVDYPTYVIDVFDKYVVYEYEGKCYKLTYTTDNRSDKVQLSNEPPVEVRRVTSYKAVSLNLSANEVEEGDDYMAVKLNEAQRKQYVDNLTTNACSCPNTMPWKGKDAAALNAMSDDVLMAYEEVRKSLTTTPATNTTTTTTVTNRDTFQDALGNKHVWNVQTNQWDTYPAHIVPVAQPVVPNGQPGPTFQNPGNTHIPNTTNQPVAVQVKPQTEEEWFKNAPASIQQAVRNAIQMNNEEKANLICQLLNNQAVEVQEQIAQIYNRMELSELRLMVAGLPKQAQTSPLGNIFNFSGAAGVPTQQAVTEESMPSPVYNYAKTA